MTFASRDARLGIGVVVVFVLGAALTAPAQAENAVAAREHYERGTKYYDIGKYDEAIREFEAAYEAKSDPAIIYNLAQAHRLAGHNQEALQLYRNYLRYVPRPANRADIEERIRTLEKAIAERPSGVGTAPVTSPPATPPPTTGTAGPSASPASGNNAAPPMPGYTPPAGGPNGAEGPPPAATAPPYPPPYPPDGTGGLPQAQPSVDYGGATQPSAPPPARSSRRKAGIVIAAVGGAFLVGGAVSGIVAWNASKTVERAADNRDQFDPSVESTGRAAATIQWVGYGIGAVGLGLGLILIATAPSAHEADPPRVAALPLVGPGLGGALVRMTF